MGPDVVVVGAPKAPYSVGIGQAVEDLLVEACVAQTGVEALDGAVLLRMRRISKQSGGLFARRLAGVDVVPLDAVVAGPLQDGLAGELGAPRHGLSDQWRFHGSITDDADGVAIDPNQHIQVPCNPGTGDAGVGNQAEVFAAAIVVHGQGELLGASGSSPRASERAAGPKGVGHRAMRTPLVRVTMARVQGPS